MSDVPTLRPAGISDLDGIERCTRLAYGVYLDRLGYEPKPMGTDYRPFLEAGFLWVLERDGAVVGLLVLEEGDGFLLIYSVAIDPALQGKGQGRRLMAFAEDETRRRALPELRLYTNERMTENRAFYAGLGFRPFARRPHPTQPNSWAIHMRKVLAD